MAHSAADAQGLSASASCTLAAACLAVFFGVLWFACGTKSYTLPEEQRADRKVRTRRQFWYIFLGTDDRVSTSQVPFALWTVAFAYVLLVNAFHNGVRLVGTPGPLYLLLFGLPAVAAVSARAITVELVSGGVVSKNPPEFKRKTPVTAVKDIVANDQGDIDLGDTQYFIFTLVTLAAFFIAFFRDPARPPTLPYALVGLASASAVVYVAKKASEAVYLVKKTSAARMWAAHPVDPRDASYRYGRLLHAPLRPSQLAAVAVAAVVPLVVGTLLVGAVAEQPAKQAVGIYLDAIVLGAGLLWFLTTLLHGGAYARRRGEVLQFLLLGFLHESLKGGPTRSESPGNTPGQASVPEAGYGRVVGILSRWLNVSWLLVDAELSLTRSNGFSVFALWPDTESHLTSGESQGLSALVTRAQGLRVSAVTAITAAAAGLAVDADQGWHRYPLVALSAGLLLVAAGSLIRSNWTRGQALRHKAQLVTQHSAEIIASYGLQADGPAARPAALRQLSLSILEHSSGLPAPYQTQDALPDSLDPQAASAVWESIETSLQRALLPPVVANVMGSIRVALGQLSPERSQLDVTVVTGTDAWQAAPGTGDTRFQLSGGEDRPSALFEVAVDAAGLEITPRQQEAQLPTTSASKSWAFTVDGPWASDVIVWVTLSSSGRYIQAIQLGSDDLERHGAQ